LLKRETMDQMMYIPPLNNPRTDQRPQYGLGWNVGHNEGLGATISHSGGQSGTSTYLLICRDRGIAVSVMSNTAGTGSPANLAYALARLTAGVPEPAPVAH
jgi:hypothetical protein